MKKTHKNFRVDYSSAIKSIGIGDEEFESLKDIELPDVDELVNQVNALSKKTMKDNYDPDKDSAFVDDNNE